MNKELIERQHYCLRKEEFLGCVASMNTPLPVPLKEASLMLAVWMGVHYLDFFQFVTNCDSWTHALLLFQVFTCK